MYSFKTRNNIRKVNALARLQDFKARSRFIDVVSTPRVKQQPTLLFKKTKRKSLWVIIYIRPQTILVSDLRQGHSNKKTLVYREYYFQSKNSTSYSHDLRQFNQHFSKKWGKKHKNNENSIEMHLEVVVWTPLWFCLRTFFAVMPMCRSVRTWNKRYCQWEIISKRARKCFLGTQTNVPYWYKAQSLANIVSPHKYASCYGSWTAKHSSENMTTITFAIFTITFST